jgi:ABC-type branched-subunit amino acid transport system substrate-binding protein
MRRAGQNMTRESFQKALDGMKGYDAGGYFVNFSPTDHNGSSFVELTVLGRDKKYSY